MIQNPFGLRKGVFFMPERKECGQPTKELSNKKRAGGMPRRSKKWKNNCWH